MIPKKIHYIWLWWGGKSQLFEQCFASWKKYCPEYDIIQRDESNLDLQHPYIQKALKEKKRAFASDVARLNILHQHGGIYLDTDMELLAPLDTLLQYQGFIGKEDKQRINMAICGSIKKHPLIKKCLDAYNNKKTFVEIPKVITPIFQENPSNDFWIAESAVFYPFPSRSKFNQSMILSNSIWIHRRDDSRNTRNQIVLKKRIPKSIIILIWKLLNIVWLKQWAKKILKI